MSLALMVNIDDVLSSLSMNGLTLAEQGAMWRILLYIWKALNKTGEGLADDDVTLAQLATVSLRAWRGRFGARVKSRLTLANGRWTHPRLLEELERWRKKQTGTSAHASIAARARWDKAKRKPPTSEGLTRAAEILPATGIVPASSEHAAGMLEQCSEHATAYGVLHTGVASEAESRGVRSMPPFHEVVNFTAHDVEQARQILHQAARGSPAGEREPDPQITAKILIAAGGLKPLLERLAEFRNQRRDLRHLDKYGWFLRVVERERARAG